ncbi:hypothetical protein [Streptomyces rubiginosohelvolus]|uniref:hypothetical protein n=1 Tax=Streptomyces rubiginosohelvolus TaxID=67362 RepID=UPI0033F74A08
MNQRSRITGQTAPTDPDIAEAFRQVVTTPTARPRTLIAAGVKRGNGRFAIQAVSA